MKTLAHELLEERLAKQRQYVLTNTRARWGFVAFGIALVVAVKLAGLTPISFGFLVGFALAKGGKAAAAAEQYRKAIEIGGETPELLNALGEAEFLSGGAEAAVAALSRSLELQPDQPGVKALLEEVKRPR